MITGVVYFLIATNAAVYVVLAIGLSRRLDKFPRDATLEEAFKILEEELKKRYPDLPEGYTWNEVLIKLKRSSTKTKHSDWANIENTLKQYEAFRYGGVDYKEVDPRSIVRLAKQLPRGEKVVR